MSGSRAGNIGRAVFLTTSVATVAWAFTAPPTTARVDPEVTLENIENKAPASQADIAAWMQRTAKEGGVGASATLEAALGQVGPWAGNQTAADNEVRAAVPSTQKKK